MKTLITFLALGLFLSTNAYADKAEITFVWHGGNMALYKSDGMGCTFACDSAFIASYYAHKNSALSLQLLVGEKSTVNLATWVPTPYSNGTVIWNSGCFSIPPGTDFSIAWVLESTKNGRIIDAEEAWTGTCEP